MIKNGMSINDRYLLLRLIGRGSYGQVWEACDTTSNYPIKTVAIKIVIIINSIKIFTVPSLIRISERIKDFIKY